jgi:ribosomal protein L40E
VRRDSQVLICPRCQASDDWMADLARCPRCGSVHLVRRLGEVECRDCGAIVPPSADSEPLAEVAGGDVTGVTAVAGGPSPDLSEEVARALDRVLGRGLVSQSAPRTSADSH